MRTFRAELTVAALIGLTATLRVFEPPYTVAAPEEVLKRYGPVVQGLLDP